MKKLRNISVIDEKLSGTRWYFYLHPVVRRLYQETRLAVKKYAKGKTLDLGAGHLAWRDLLKENGVSIEYTSLDIKHSHPELDVVADVCHGAPFPDGRFDTIFCSQVLEHVAEPSAFLNEAYRLTRRGGYIILTTPFSLLYSRRG